MKTTTIGQLALLLLIERLHINNFEVLSANTDGVVSRFKKDRYNEFMSICKKWEIDTKLELEETQYDLLVMSNINNYLAIKKGNKEVKDRVKLKGWFEIDKLPHKNHSMRIIPLAVYEYFINQKDYRTFIYNHEDKFDFCKGVKAKKDSYFITRDVLKTKKEEKVDKLVRYYISKDGIKLIKILPALKQSVYENTLFDGVFEVPREIEAESGYLITYVNEIKNFSFENLNYEYYIKECKKIIDPIEKTTRI